VGRKYRGRRGGSSDFQLVEMLVLPAGKKKGVDFYEEREKKGKKYCYCKRSGSRPEKKTGEGHFLSALTKGEKKRGGMRRRRVLSTGRKGVIPSILAGQVGGG